MQTEAQARGMGRQGFTLVEVLVSMIILAVGLLALESLAIGGARMVARAERETQYTALATEHLERALERIDQGQNPPGQQFSQPDGSLVQTVVTRAPAGGQFVYTVAVTVTPPQQRSWTLQPITVVGRAYR